VTEDAFTVEHGDDGCGCGVEGEDEPVGGEGCGLVVLVEGHESVDAECEAGDGVELEHEFGGYWEGVLVVIIRMVVGGTNVLGSAGALRDARS